MALTHKCKISRPSLPHSHLKHSHLDTNPCVDSVPHRPSRLIPNPNILEIEYPYEEYHQFLLEQQHIGWDNFLCGKILKQWLIYQQNYEQTQHHHQCISNRLKELKNSSLLKKKKRKKNPPNVFQTLMVSIFTAAHKEMWTQHNKDHHRRTNCTSATAVEKIDKQIKFLYAKIDSVLTYKGVKYFFITLDQRLQQLLKKKQ